MPSETVRSRLEERGVWIPARRPALRKYLIEASSQSVMGAQWSSHNERGPFVSGPDHRRDASRRSGARHVRAGARHDRTRIASWARQPLMYAVHIALSIDPARRNSGAAKSLADRSRVVRGYPSSTPFVRWYTNRLGSESNVASTTQRGTQFSIAYLHQPIGIELTTILNDLLR